MPLLQLDEAVEAALRGNPAGVPAAGIGDPEEVAWLCEECAGHLCREKPVLPPLSLSNVNWGAREHPKYQNLSMAMRSMLGLGKMLMRLVLLKGGGEDENELEKALVGNTILVAQPTPKMITEKLPPNPEQQASYFHVVYPPANDGGSGASKMKKQKALLIDREEYLECAEIRRQRCPLFAAVGLSAEDAQEFLPSEGVAPGTEQGSVQMDGLEHFAPTLSGPASRSEPFRKDAEDDEEGEEVEEVEEEEPTEDTGEACSTSRDALLIAEEHENAEFLIGFDASPDEDAAGKLASMQAKVKMAEDLGRRISLATSRLRQTQEREASLAESTGESMVAAADLAALQADHKALLVDLGTLARRMGDSFHQEIEQNITAAFRQSSPATLRIHTGAPLSFYDPASWVACCTEFELGDCVPNLERRAKVSFRRLWDHLANREELEYSLPSDETPYKANPDSRWNKPELIALAADTCRKLEANRRSEEELNIRGSSEQTFGRAVG